MSIPDATTAHKAKPPTVYPEIVWHGNSYFYQYSDTRGHVYARAYVNKYNETYTYYLVLPRHISQPFEGHTIYWAKTSARGT